VALARWLTVDLRLLLGARPASRGWDYAAEVGRAPSNSDHLEGLATGLLWELSRERLVL